MPETTSMIDPNGPLACTIETLEHLGCDEEVREIRRLLIERAQFREHVAELGIKLEHALKEEKRTSDRARRAERIARHCLQKWRSLALIHESQEELAKIETMVQQYPFLHATAA